jgi:hypothetical protein
MRSIKRELLSCLAISALVFTGADSWGRPFVERASGPALSLAQEPQPQQPPQDQAKSATFTGTIVRDGDMFVLHDSSGQVYKLDDTQRAKPFEGKTVKVSGQLDTEAKLIHVDTIEGVEA